MTLSSYDQINLRILDKLCNSIVWKMKPPTLFYYFWFSCSSNRISLASITLPRNVNYLFSFVIIYSSHLSFDILKFTILLCTLRDIAGSWYNNQRIRRYPVLHIQRWRNIENENKTLWWVILENRQEKFIIDTLHLGTMDEPIFTETTNRRCDSNSTRFLRYSPWSRTIFIGR